MILAVDVGNTILTLGCISRGKAIFTEHISSDKNKTGLEYAIILKTVYEIHCLTPSETEGCILSCVVPSLSRVLEEAILKFLGKKPIVVGPGIKTGLKIMINNPAQLGSDLAAAAVAALEEYPLPCVIIDMGTATTFSVLDDRKQFRGGAIVPGVRVALRSLSSYTAQLPDISLDGPVSVIGTNTVDCMKSGSILGCASMIDGMLCRIEEEMNRPMTAIATGDIAPYIIPHCRHKILRDDNLMLKGLEYIYRKNETASRF